MKRCPECRRDYYDETLLYCLDDGTPLLEGPATADPEEPLTARMQVPATPSHPGSENPTKALDAELFSREVRSHKARWAAIAVVGMLVLTGFGYGLYKFFKPAAIPLPPPKASNIQTQRLSGDGRTRVPVISPDGKFLVYVRMEDGKESLWIKQIATGANVNVVKPGEGSAFNGITFSPDGNFVYFNATMGKLEAPGIYRVPTLGGAPTKFLSDALFVQFSYDGKRIAFRRPNASEQTETVIIANADGSGERVMSTRAGKQYFNTAPVWSPDGKLIAVGVGDDDLGSANCANVATIEVDTGETAVLGSRRWDYVDDLVWHPTGDSLLMVAAENLGLGQIWEITYPAGVSRALSNNLNGHTGISVTADGLSIVTGERYARSAVWVSPDLKAENAKQVMPATGDTWGLAWMPDGRIAYISDQTGNAEVWIMNADGSAARSLTSDGTFKTSPSSSPDGKYIVFTSSKNGGEIVRLDAGSGEQLVLTHAIGADNAHISPDGQWVIYSAFVEGRQTVLRVSIDGGEEKVLMGYHATEPRYSNDGARIACILLDEKFLTWTKLAIVDAAGGQPATIIEVPETISSSRGPVWTPDDKAIILINSPGEKQELWMQPLDGSPGKQITNVGIPGISRRDYSKDGKRIAITRSEGISNAIMLTGFR